MNERVLMPFSVKGKYLKGADFFTFMFLEVLLVCYKLF